MLGFLMFSAFNVCHLTPTKYDFGAVVSSREFIINEIKGNIILEIIFKVSFPVPYAHIQIIETKLNIQGKTVKYQNFFELYLTVILVSSVLFW